MDFLSELLMNSIRNLVSNIYVSFNFVNLTIINEIPTYIANITLLLSKYMPHTSLLNTIGFHLQQNLDSILKNLVEIYEQHPEYGILSPMHLNVKKDGLVMEYFCRRPDNKKLIEDLYLNQLTDVYDTKYIHAAAWMLSRNTLEMVGGFNPIFQHYEEDGEYLNRVIYYQLKIGVCPSARIVHDHQSKTFTGDKALLRHNQLFSIDYDAIVLYLQ